MNERQTIDRGWFYVKKTEGRKRRLHGYPGKIVVHDVGGGPFSLAYCMRVAAEIGFQMEADGLGFEPRVRVNVQ